VNIHVGKFDVYDYHQGDISNNTINRHTQNMKQLKTESSMRAEEAKSHNNQLITNTIYIH
jgi:hypothetical protein